MNPLPRSYLFVPGLRPPMFGKALGSGADIVVLDLEDAVAADHKAQARAEVRAWLDSAEAAAAGERIALRVNAAATAEFAHDLALAAHPRVRTVLLPKAEHVEDVAWVAQAAPQAALVPIVESALGLDAARLLAAAPGVHRLAFGTLDFALDMQMSIDDAGDQAELATFRTQLALSSRLAGIAPPIDGVTTAFDDEPRVLRDTLRARRFGFGAKLCIHPRQVLAVHNAFAPTPAEIEWAQRVVEANRAAGGNAAQVDGRMVDLPVLLQAEALLARRT
jgi:citrate lyase subunit beta/citryl-CoA lyase